ncbi:MAG: M67 family metallopeptidase [Spirochaetaceae bacterium]|jgi:proteasome lid subunit RPN8/RPN11|nr:M67 family metallopeptidase [Spirochaetaceae bacterium]
MIIPPDLKARIAEEALKAYPNECCGILLGPNEREISKILPIINAFSEDERYHRFKIEPEDLMRAERQAFQDGLEVLGFYHSHPDHPAVPSEYDREQALPFYAYTIVEVHQNRAGDFRLWRLKEDRTAFQEFFFS